MIKQTQMWVHPSFKKKLKRQALDEDISVLCLTRKLGDELKTVEKKVLKKRKNGFNFQI